MYPRVTFVIPTYNAAEHISQCLESIMRQDFPKDKIEILIADGGSTDKTVQIAESYNTTVIPNPRRLAECGVQAGVMKANGDLIVIFAADNELYSREWLKKVSIPFIKDDEIAAVWGRLISGKADPAINKYFELIQSDPFSHFMNKNLEYYLTHSKVVKGENGAYYVFKVSESKPLVWGANGLTYRKSSIQQIWDTDKYLGDNDAFQCMIEATTNKVAYVPSLLTYHHHVKSIQEWTTKWKRNFSSHFLEQRKSRNLNWVFTENFNVKLAMWVIYSLCPFFSLMDSIKNAVRDRNRYWLYHPTACLTQTLIYVSILLFTLKGRRALTEKLFKSSSFAHI